MKRLLALVALLWLAGLQLAEAQPAVYNQNYLTLPAWANSTRPQTASPNTFNAGVAPGTMGWNSQQGLPEYWSGSAWTGFGSGGGGLNGFLTCTAGVCTFTGADGSTQAMVGNISGSVEWLQLLGATLGGGGSAICRNQAQSGNVNCNFTAQGSGNDLFNNGHGNLGGFVDAGGASTGGGTITPGTGGGPAGFHNANGNGVNLDCGTSEVCTAGGQPIATFGGVYALNVNGDFQIDQPNEGGTSTAGNARVTDGWFQASTKGGIITFQRSLTVYPTTAGTYYSTSETMTNGSAQTIGATDLVLVQTFVTGQEAAQLRWGHAEARAATLDLCMEGNANLTYPANIPVTLGNAQGGGTYRSFVHLVNLTAASTWTCTSIAIPGDTSGTWVGQSSTTTSISIGITFGCGSNFQTSTLDAWFTPGVSTNPGLCTSTSTSVATVASGAINVTGVHLRLGTQNYLASPFQAMPYSVEYARARQRYWKSFKIGTAPANSAGTGTGEIQFPATATTTGTQRLPSILLPSMVAAPSMTFFNPSAANANCRDETAAADGGAATGANVTSTGFNVTCTGNASTAVNNVIGVHAVADTGL